MLKKLLIILASIVVCVVSLEIAKRTVQTNYVSAVNKITSAQTAYHGIVAREGSCRGSVVFSGSVDTKVHFDAFLEELNQLARKFPLFRPRGAFNVRVLDQEPELVASRARQHDERSKK